MIKVKKIDLKKNQNVYSVKEKKIKMFTVSKEKNYKCQDLKKNIFEQDCVVRLSLAYWGEKKVCLKSVSIFVFPLLFDRKNNGANFQIDFGAFKTAGMQTSPFLRYLTGRRLYFAEYILWQLWL